MHGREDSGVPSSGQIVSGLEQHVMYIDGSLGRDPQRGEHRDHNVVPPVRDPTHLQPAPPRLSRRLSKVPLLHHLEPDPTRRRSNIGVTPEPRQCVPPLNALNDFDVFGVVAYVLVGGDPLVGHVEGTGLQDAEDFGVDLLELGRVTRGLDGVRAVEAVVGKWHVEEVAAHHLAQRVQPGLLVVEPGPLHLILYYILYYHSQ